MKLSEKQATLLVDHYKATLGLVSRELLPRNFRAKVYNQILNQQSDEPIEIDEEKKSSGPGSSVYKLIESVEKKLPKMREAALSPSESVILHQDAFAADLQPDELMLLGSVIKYLGLFGKEIHIIGNNGETIKQESKANQTKS